MAENPVPAAFDELVDVYDSLIDWPRRLAHEEPFFRRAFTEVNARRVLDAACGTGHHAAMFHRWGMDVEGADLSPAMIARCRERYGENERLRWQVRSFEDAVEARGRFDADVCIGNSLALAHDAAGVRRAMAAMIAALRSGGVGIIQVLNLWRIQEGPTIWQKCESRTDAAGHRVLLKGLHRVGGRGYVDLIDLRMTSAGLVKRFDTPSFMGIEAEDLAAAVKAGGGRDVRLFGGYDAEPYDRNQSVDLICVFKS